MKESLKSKLNYHKIKMNKEKEPIFIVDPETGAILDVNLAACKYYCYSREILMKKNIFDINIKPREEIINEMEKVKNNELNVFKFKHRLASGEVREVEVEANTINSEGKILLISRVKDLDKKYLPLSELVRKKSHFDKVFYNSIEAIALMDKDFKILDVNQRFKNIFQVKLLDVISKDIDDVITSPTHSKESLQFRKTILSGQFISKEVKRQTNDGRILNILLLGFPLLIEGEVHGTYYIFTDISQYKHQDEKIRLLTYVDELTKLFNRNFLEDNMDKTLKNANCIKDRYAVMIISLNEYKEISGILGLDFGKKVIKEIGNKLRVTVSKANIIARYSEDQFAVFITNDKEIENIDLLANRIVKTLKKTIIIECNALQISTNIGYSKYPNDDTNFIGLLRKAEVALYKSQIKGVNSVVNFDKDHDRQVQEYFMVKKDLPKSIEKGELHLNYQPIYDAKKNQIKGVEALVRWNHPKLGLVSPLEFITIAEKMGLIHQLGEKVMHEACQQNKIWQDKGFDPVYISVNVSITELERDDFEERLVKVLKQTKLNPKHLVIEITETILTNDYQLIKDKINRISKIGVRFSIDDFGTGYSSLSQLFELKINNLKIDKKFIDDVSLNENKSTIVKAIISLAKSLNISITAEGVESKEELTFLRKQEVDFIQGYIFSKPISATEIESKLKIARNHNLSL